MCVIAIAEKSFPSLDQLKKMEASNPDGAGVAWVEAGKVHWIKGVNATQIHQMRKKIKLPAIVHFRIATVGGVRPTLCHPFVIDENATQKLVGEADAVLFHNGNWGSWKDKLASSILGSGRKFPKGEWSDTRAMALLAFQHGWEFLEMFIENQKIVSINGHGKIKTIGTWEKWEGFRVSNNYFDVCSRPAVNYNHHDWSMGASLWKDTALGGYRGRKGDKHHAFTTPEPIALKDAMASVSERIGFDVGRVHESPEPTHAEIQQAIKEAEGVADREAYIDFLNSDSMDGVSIDRMHLDAIDGGEGGDGE